MDENFYRARRAKLVGEFMQMKKLRLYRSAAARVRQIAKLDEEQLGEKPEKTMAVFGYSELLRKI